MCCLMKWVVYSAQSWIPVLNEGSEACTPPSPPAGPRGGCSDLSLLWCDVWVVLWVSCMWHFPGRKLKAGAAIHSKGAQNGTTPARSFHLYTHTHTLCHRSVRAFQLFDLSNWLLTSPAFGYIIETAFPSNSDCWFRSGVPLGSGWMHIPPTQAKETDPRIPSRRNVHNLHPGCRK